MSDAENILCDPCRAGRVAADAVSAARLPEHLYVHVPFCRAKCAYCDFYSVGGRVSDQRAARVFAKLSWDLLEWAELRLPGELKTVYVGGGTPSLFAEQVADLVRCILRILPVAGDAEITAEANPESLSLAAAHSFVAAGVTRISVGIQSFDDALLRLLGRPHDSAQAFAACEAVLQAGAALSVDLICGIPGQSLAVWEETLASAIATGARHVSVYPLAIEDGTPLAALIESGELTAPDSDLAADMMLLAEKVLGEAGIQRYEVANYAVPGFESKHNSAYWTGKPYIGLGPSAHGMLDIATARAARSAIGVRAAALSPEATRLRYSEPADIDEWLLGREVCVEPLTQPESRREDLMLGMRLTSGVAEPDVADAHLEAVFAQLVEDGLIERYRHESGSARFRTTRRGWLLGNQVFGRIWTAE